MILDASRTRVARTLGILTDISSRTARKARHYERNYSYAMYWIEKKNATIFLPQNSELSSIKMLFSRIFWN